MARKKGKIRKERFVGNAQTFAEVALVRPGEPRPEDALDRLRRVVAERDAKPETETA